jgi:flagellar hook-associated protein 2
MITKTIEAASKPKTQWQNSIDTLEVKKTLYQQLQSKLNSLRTKMTSLRLPDAYKKKTAEFTVFSPAGATAESIVSATVAANAEFTSWDIDVKSLARSQRHVSTRFDSRTESLGISGSFRIHMGSSYAEITVGTDDTLLTINEKIANAADQHGNKLNVSAKLLDNRLVIESLVSGTNNTGAKLGEKMTMVGDAGKVAVDPNDLSKGYNYEMYLPRSTVWDETNKKYVYPSEYPKQILELVYETKNVDGSSYYYQYKAGTDFDYDPANGKITWLKDGQRPPAGAEVNAIYRRDDLRITRNEAYVFPDMSTDPTKDLIPLTSAGEFFDAGLGFSIIAGGTEYVEGADFNIVNVLDTSSAVVGQAIEWSASVTRPANGSSYFLQAGTNVNYSTNESVFYMEPSDGIYDSDSVLAQLGFITPGNANDDWTFTDGSFREATDAVFSVDGVEMTRSSNTISDIIADVTFELKGSGSVRLNVTQDVTDTIAALESFVEEYNAVMEWINYYMSQKEDAANPVDEEDFLSSILSDSKGSTVFGVLHGDQLLSSIKNQLRTKLSSPLAMISGSVASRRVQHPSEALNVQGSFYLYIGGKATRIDVAKSDSLEDIKEKLDLSTNIFSPSDSSTPSGTSMGLKVAINDGQLIIGGSGNVSFSASNQATFDTNNGMIKREGGQNYDLLPFVPVSQSPISGKLTIYTGAYQTDSSGNVIQEPTIYEEGRDYRIVTETNSNGVMQSRVEWLSGGKSPTAGKSYSYSYSYMADAVMISEIQGSGGIGNNSYGVSWLDFTADSGKAMMANFGFTTEAAEYGKSGYLEFDSEKFFSKVQEDSGIVSNVMLTFMRDLDSYIGNLVDSSQIVVGGQIVTKGRIAAALNSIDTEQSTLNERIAKLEKDLETKQTAMYKQYSDMEVAIQKLNAQMSAVSNFMSSMSSSSSSSA